MTKYDTLIQRKAFMKKQTNNHVFTLILAGGGGTRLWPKSRKKTPKQFLKLTGDKTMLQVTADRFSKITPWENILVISNKNYVDEVKAQLPQVPSQNILFEPEKKDTALAMLVGTVFAKTKDPQAIIINGASDHVVKDEEEFAKLMKAASKAAEDESKLIAVGITPTYPATGFGYIKVGQEVGKIDRDVSLFKVDSFTEKPNLATAQAFISTGQYFWNANNYVWSADALLEAFKKYFRTDYDLVQPLLKIKKATKFQASLDKIYQKAENISIDYAISEKVDNLYLIPGDFGWDDIGEWKVVYDLGRKDLHGNVITADSENKQVKVLTIESRNNLVHNDKRMIALLGVDELVIIDTPEILLVMPKSKSQNVKKIVQRLKTDGLVEYL